MRGSRKQIPRSKKKKNVGSLTGSSNLNKTGSGPKTASDPKTFRNERNGILSQDDVNISGS